MNGNKYLPFLYLEEGQQSNEEDLIRVEERAEFELRCAILQLSTIVSPEHLEWLIKDALEDLVYSQQKIAGY